MARIANNFCRKIYITDDNPRDEEPKKIRDELARYIPKDKVFNIGNSDKGMKVKDIVKIMHKKYKSKKNIKFKKINIGNPY